MTSEIVRRSPELSFDAAAVPRLWYGGDAFLTTYWNAFSLLLPEGERFFVDSVKHYRKQITDPALAADVVGFIGQEAMHGKAHRAFNDMLIEQGFEAVPQLERQFSFILDLGRRVLSHEAQLGATCAVEHFTSIMGHHLLEDESHHGAIDDRVRALWTWHALEETEHKAVAYDVYRAIGGSYATRIGSMLLASAVFILVLIYLQTRLIWAEPSRVHLARGLWHLWIRPGLFRRMLGPYFDYFRPSFHPNDRDARTLVSAWREKLFPA